MAAPVLHREWSGRPGKNADNSPSPTAEVKNDRSYTSTPPLSLHGVDTDNSNFNFLQHTVRLGNQTARTEVDMCWLYYSVALIVVTRQVLRILKGNPLDNEPLHFSYWFSGWISDFM